MITILLIMLLWSAVMIGVFAVATWASRKRERTELPPMPCPADVRHCTVHYTAMDTPSPAEPLTELDFTTAKASFIGPKCHLLPLEQGKEYTIMLAVYWNEKVCVQVQEMQGWPMLGYASRADFDADWAIVSHALQA